MKPFLIAAVALAVAAPAAVSFVPATAEAQVLAGRNAARAATRPSRPALTEREEERLYAAQDEVQTLETQIEDIRAAGEQQEGGLTAEQTAQITEREARIAEHQRVIDRLEAKRARRN
jgi:hypothetical protein